MQSQNTQNGIPRYLRESERQDLSRDIAQLEEMERNKDKNGASPAHIQDVRRAHRRMVESIEQQTPPDISKTEEDRLHKRIKNHEEILRQGILSRETMRRNPEGASDRHITWENKVVEGVRNKDRCRMLKEDIKTFMKGAAGEDIRPLLNIDRLRPQTEPVDFTGADVQIPKTRTWVHLPGEDYPHPKAIDWESFMDSSRHQAEMRLEDERVRAAAEIEAARREAEQAKAEAAQLREKLSRQGNPHQKR